MFCKTPLDPKTAPVNDSNDASVQSLGLPYYVTVDTGSGDIYWTEYFESRVLVLRGGRGNPKRVAGTGVSSPELVTSAGVALLTNLSGPTRITIDGTGAPVFIDGFEPGSILRLDQSGLLQVLVSLPSASDTQPVDGPFEIATALNFDAISFIDDGRTLLVSDYSPAGLWYIVRRIDLVERSITRIAGAYSGPKDDGHGLLDTRFSDVRAIADYPGEGNFAFLQHNDGKIRIAVVTTSGVSRASD